MILTRQKIYIITLITALVLVILGIFVIYPWVSEIFSLSKEVENQRLNLKKHSLRENNFKELKAKENEVDLTLRNLSKALVSENNSLDFIVLLEELAYSTNNKQSIEIVNVSDDEETNKTKDKSSGEETEMIIDPLKGIDVLYFKVKLEGKYRNLLNYLLKLESLEVYTDVTSISIKSKNANIDVSSSNKPFKETESGEDDTLNTTLQIRVFSKE